VACGIVRYSGQSENAIAASSRNLLAQGSFELNDVLEIDRLLEFDDLDPFARLPLWSDIFFPDHEGAYLILSLGSEKRRISVVVLSLLALAAVRMAIKNVLGTDFNFYLMGDESLKFVIEHAFGAQIEARQLKSSLYALNEADLIFRFTVPRKFYSAGKNQKQLRINSWGLEYLRQSKTSESHPDLTKRLDMFLEEYLSHHKAVYESLTHILMQEINQASNGRINDLNELVEVKLLS
jgi:hypothetical protein